MGWQHSIAGGQGNLIATVFKSPDYVPGVSGWAVFKDGSVEFNNGTFRGTVTAGTFEGTNFEINSSGAFFYSSAPALGNLVASITIPNTVGTDSHGNHWIGGISSYDQSSNSGIRIAQFGIDFLKNTGPGTAWTGTQSIFQALAPGFGVEIAGAGFWSFGGTPVLGGIVASDPADATGATPETWHSLGSPSIANVTVNAGRYRLTPDGEAEVDIALTATGAVAAGVYTFASTLNSAYRFPGNYSRSYAAGFNGTITTATNNADLLIDGDGTPSPGRVRLQIPALPVGTSITATPRIPLN